MNKEEYQQFLFDYLNSDISFLAVKIILEGFLNNENYFTLDQFIKEDCSKIDELSNEISDTGDYTSTESLMFRQILKIIEDLELGNIKQIKIIYLNEIIEKIEREMLNIKNATEEDFVYYSIILEEIFELRELRDERIKKQIENIRFEDNISFNENDFYDNLTYISKILTPFIEIELEFNKIGNY